MGATGLKTLTDAELKVLATAEIESGMQGLSMESRIADIFKDSLEYASFVVTLQAPDEAVTKAETLGDLANALVLPN